MKEFSQSRIVTLDIIRGFSVLGILMMNIGSFSMPHAAYTNPTAYGDLTGINYVVWLISRLFFELKFIGIFSMLFGIGIVIFCQNAEARDGGSVLMHIKRLFWLLLFGILHGHLIWYGDILFGYAICGGIVYLLKDSSVKKLWTVGLALISVSWLIYFIGQITLPFVSPAELEFFRDAWLPSDAHLALEINAYTGTWMEQFEQRSELALFLETYGLFYFMIWFNSGMMLLGMALFKQGLFVNRYRSQDLLKVACVLFIIGTSLTLSGVFYNEGVDWVMEKAQYAGSLFNAIGSLFTSLSYILFVVMLVQLKLLTSLFNKMAAVGKLALTNYISQSLICTFIFYGFGLGLFGSVERWQQLLIVLAIWVVQIQFSRWWLSRYSTGPLESVWRKLTYS